MTAGRVGKLLLSLRALGPYLLVEILLPGGTLLALLLWLSQRFKRARSGRLQRYLSGQNKAALSGKPHDPEQDRVLSRPHGCIGAEDVTPMTGGASDVPLTVMPA